MPSGCSSVSLHDTTFQQPLLAGLKHLNRLEQVIARAEWQDTEHAEGLLDQAGRVIEGVFSNLFLVRNGELITADLKRCGVEGVMRAELLFQAESLGIPTQSPISPSNSCNGLTKSLSATACMVFGPCMPAALSWPVGPLTRKLKPLPARYWMLDT
jgi:4-amino-4-deoxychorismate lyase